MQHDCQDKYARKVSYIASANQAMVEVDSIEKLLPLLLEIAEEAAAAEASSFLRYAPEDGTLTFAVVRNNGLDSDLADQLVDKVSLQPGEGIAGRAIAERKTFLVNDVAEAQDFSPRVDDATCYTTRSMITVPVIHLDEPLGVIQVLNPRNRETFDATDSQALEIFASLGAVAIVRARQMRELLKQKELEAQIQVAAKLQRHCWPKIPNMGHGSHVWGRSLPAKEVGGDLYDIINLKDGSYLLYLADVSGKGLAAGFVMAALWSTIRSHARPGIAADALLAEINRSTFAFLSGEFFFATICLLRYWPENGRLEFASGGHTPPLLLHKGLCTELPRMTGLPLGTLEDTVYSCESMTLEPGSMIALYSDGVTEAFNPDGEMFGLDRATHFFISCPREECAEKLFDELESWFAGGEQNDDITLLCLWRDTA